MPLSISSSSGSSRLIKPLPEIPAPTGLLCELLGSGQRAKIFTPFPAFSWEVPGQAGFQSAYQVKVWREPQIAGETLVLVWDSGEVSSPQSLHIRYQGPPLQPEKSYQWSVRIWDTQGVPSDWAYHQSFSTGKNLQEDATSHFDPEEVLENPVVEVEKKSGTVFADFGKVAFSRLFLMVEDCPEEGVTLTVHLGEKSGDTEFTLDRQPPGSIRYQKHEVRLSKGKNCIRLIPPPDARNTGVRAVKMPLGVAEVFPFRFCEIENIPAGIFKGLKVSRETVHYPFDEAASFFESNDLLLNQVWDLCKYTIKATSFCGIYVDGDRERIPYESDAFINQLCHYQVDREFAMGRRSWEYLMTEPTWPTEWILFSVMTAWIDYEHTGDLRPLKKWFEPLKAKTLLGLAREDGLISTRTDKLTDALMDSVGLTKKLRDFTKHGLRDLVDWPPAEFTNGGLGERDGYEMREVNTVVNAFHAHVLRLMSRIAAALGEKDDSNFFLGRSDKVVDAINQKLFDPERGIYLDGEGSTHASLHANMFPLAFDLVPAPRKFSVLAFVKSRGMACSVYGAQFLLDALFLNGEAEHAFQLMTAPHDRSWWNMVSQGSSVTWEAWDVKYKNNLDWNHAWGAAPANILPRFVLGVRPLSPGFSEILIAPNPGPLLGVCGFVPTIRGRVKVGFDITKNEKTLERDLNMELVIPGNTSARLDLSGFGAHPKVVYLNGRDVSGTSAVFEGLLPGRHIVRALFAD